MRNRYGGLCYFCNFWVKEYDGHFERYRGGWRVIHADCVYKQREIKDKLSQSVVNRNGKN